MIYIYPIKNICVFIYIYIYYLFIKSRFIVSVYLCVCVCVCMCVCVCVCQIMKTVHRCALSQFLLIVHRSGNWQAYDSGCSAS